MSLYRRFLMYFVQKARTFFNIRVKFLYIGQLGVDICKKVQYTAYCIFAFCGLLEGYVMDNCKLPIAQAAAGDQEAFALLVHRMAPLIHAQVHSFRCAGIEDEDLVQEALTGLLSAVRTFREDGGATFTTYATACIRHRLSSIVRRYGALADREVPIEDNPDLPDTAADPALRLQEQEELEGLLTRLRTRLTEMEYRVLLLRLGDCSYAEIAARLGITPKAVDNAVQRMRRKLT